MSTETYEPGKLYLIDVDGVTHQATCRRYSDGAAVFLTYDGAVISGLKAENPRPAIVLDPEDEAVQAFVKVYDLTGTRHEGTNQEGAPNRVAAKIAAQITPPEPPMEEPTELLERVTDDAGNWVRWSNSTRTFEPWAWCHSLGIDTRQTRRWSQMQNPRSYENPREKHATAPQSDKQGSGSGIGRVSESEAVEGGLDAWRKRMRAFGGIL